MRESIMRFKNEKYCTLKLILNYTGNQQIVIRDTVMWSRIFNLKISLVAEFWIRYNRETM